MVFYSVRLPMSKRLTQATHCTITSSSKSVFMCKLLPSGAMSQKVVLNNGSRQCTQDFISIFYIHHLFSTCTLQSDQSESERSSLLITIHCSRFRWNVSLKGSAFKLRCPLDLDQKGLSIPLFHQHLVEVFPKSTLLNSFLNERRDPHTVSDLPS